MNRKGQEAVQSFGISGAILIVFLVLVLGAIYLVYVYIQGATQGAPKDTSIIAGACSGYISLGELGENDYCYVFRVLDNGEYVNCPYLIQKYKVAVQGSDSLPFICKEDSITTNRDIKCKALVDSKIKINGFTCSYWIAKSITGKCSGIATTCESIGLTGDVGDCEKQMNCKIVNSKCASPSGAILVQCLDITGEEQCTSQKGCTWTANSASVTGTKTCQTIGATPKTTCEKYKTPTECSDAKPLGQTCEWKATA